MEMFYRGVRSQYNPSSVKIEQKDNVNQLKYRGSTYQANHGQITLPKSSAPDIVYRGVSVATGKQIRFLGRTCEQKKVVLCPLGV